VKEEFSSNCIITFWVGAEIEAAMLVWQKSILFLRTSKSFALIKDFSFKNK